MCWLKRNLWKTGIAIAGMLLLLVLMVRVPVSGFTGTVTATVQATPTVDATVTALNKEKLAQEVQQLKNQNEPDLLGWLRTNAAVLVVVLGGLIGLFRWFGDRRSEREKRDEDRFQAVVADLGSNNIEARVGAAIMLCAFLQPGYERFYRQAFDLAVAHLRLRKSDLEIKDDPEAPVLASLNQALIVVFKVAFPGTREWVKQGSPSSRLQRLKARLKRILRREKAFEPQYLDASRVRLDNAYLTGTDLKKIWMREASLIWSKLRKAKLCEANLREADLRGADLHNADLRKADLHQANLSEALLSEANLNGVNLRRANLCKAHLRQTDLSEADLSEADLSEADLSGANLTETNPEAAASLKGTKMSNIFGLTQEQREACVKAGAIFDSFNPSIASATNPSSSPPSSQRDDVQAPSAPPAQGSTPSPGNRREIRTHFEVKLTKSARIEQR